MILVPGGVRIWLATGMTDMRRGMNTLALHPVEHLKGFAGIFQVDIYAGFNAPYVAGKSPGPVTEAGC